MKAYRLTEPWTIGDCGIEIQAGSIVLILDEESAPGVDGAEEIPDGTPISIPASRTMPA